METAVFGGHPFTLAEKNAFSAVYFNENLKMAICAAEDEYIPIEHFKKNFENISQLVERIEISSFVFDKRKLRTFHQPSMEWYFSVWKPAIKDKGLKHHYKILPDLDWFVKAVEAGKHEIYQKFGRDIVNGISINYVASIEEAIEKVSMRQ
jgi:hypothetical protein